MEQVYLECLPWEDAVEEMQPSFVDVERAITDAEELVDDALLEFDDVFSIDVAS
jgi:hypothetical protein